jgi:hypothetical protein
MCPVTDCREDGVCIGLGARLSNALHAIPVHLATASRLQGSSPTCPEASQHGMLGCFLGQAAAAPSKGPVEQSRAGPLQPATTAHLEHPGGAHMPRASAESSPLCQQTFHIPLQQRWMPWVVPCGTPSNPHPKWTMCSAAFPVLFAARRSWPMFVCSNRSTGNTLPAPVALLLASPGTDQPAKHSPGLDWCW